MKTVQVHLIIRITKWITSGVNEKPVTRSSVRKEKKTEMT